MVTIEWLLYRFSIILLTMIGKNKKITHESKKTVSYLKVENLKVNAILF